MLTSSDPVRDTSLELLSSGADRKPSTHLAYRPDIDGLRALAVTSVIAFHTGAAKVPGGFVGVDVFFVISGYLIGSIIYRDVVGDRYSFATFYIRRARRIIPALFTLLACTGMAALVLLTADELTKYAREAIATIFAMSNVWFWYKSNYFAASAALHPLLMTWSLGIEEQFYFFLPPLMLFIARFSKKALGPAIAAVTIASLGLSIIQSTRLPDAAFYLLPARAWELGAGTLLAIAEFSKSRQPTALRSRWVREITAIVGIAFVAMSIAIFNVNTPFPGWAALLPVVGTLALLSTRTSLVNCALGWQPLRFIGKISYSWYLWHWPLLSFARIAADGVLSTRATVLIVALSFVCAVLSWRFVEQPFRSRHAPGRSFLRGYALAMVAIIAISLSLKLNHGWPARFDQRVATIERTKLDVVEDPCLVRYGDVIPARTTPCRVSNIGHGTIALVGDSHAAALGPAIRAFAARNGYGFIQYTKSSCAPLVGLTRRQPSHPAHEDECSRFAIRTFREIFQSSSISAVILAGYWSAPFTEAGSGERYVPWGALGTPVSDAESKENFASALERTIDTLRAEKRHVILASDVPLFDFDPLAHTEAQYIPLRRAVEHLVSSVLDIENGAAPERDLLKQGEDSRSIISSAIVRHSGKGVTFWDLPKLFCQHASCRFALGSDLYYIDYQHLSRAGAFRAVSGLRMMTK